jgi:hypothetical protein
VPKGLTRSVFTYLTLPHEFGWIESKRPQAGMADAAIPSSAIVSFKLIKLVLFYAKYPGADFRMFAYLQF